MGDTPLWQLVVLAIIALIVSPFYLAYRAIKGAVKRLRRKR